jgi:hypothetical protein
VDVGDLVLPESFGVVIEENRVIVRVDLDDGEGDASEDTAESVLNDEIATSQYSYRFTPAGGHVDHLERV